MSLDRQTARKDHPRSEEDEVQTQEPIRTLLWTAATIRPLDEVAALVGLLRRTGEVPSPADEALRAAAVARPLDEVRQLVLMLNEPPEQSEEVAATLRAAAVGRSIEDVVQLVSILGTDDATAAEARRGRPAEVGVTAARIVRVAAPEPAGEPAAQATAEEPPAEAAPPQAVRPDEGAEQTGEPEPRAGTFRFVPPTVRPQEAARTSPEQHAVPEPPEQHAAPTSSERHAGPASPERHTARTSPRRQATARAAAQHQAAPAPGGLQALRSALRWPAGAALVVMGLIHLPKDLTELRSGGYADALSVVITVLCLVLAVWLMVQDMVWTWTASAVAASTVLVVHSMVGFGSVTLPDSSLGGTYVWARTIALVCAIAGLALCGSALMRRRTESVTGDVQS